MRWNVFLIILFPCLWLSGCGGGNEKSIDELCQVSNSASSGLTDNQLIEFAKQATFTVLNASAQNPPYPFYTPDAWKHYNDYYIAGADTSAREVAITYTGNVTISKQCLIDQRPSWIVNLPIRADFKSKATGEVASASYNVRQLLELNNQNKLVIIRTEMLQH